MIEELKTLKDLKYNYEGEDDIVVDYDSLRAEAIKWIKHIRKEFKLDEQQGYHKSTVEEWIISFFNITNEELK